MTTPEPFRALEKTVEQLAHQLGMLEDTHAIRDLPHKHGYDIDKGP